MSSCRQCQGHGLDITLGNQQFRIDCPECNRLKELKRIRYSSKRSKSYITSILLITLILSIILNILI